MKNLKSTVSVFLAVTTLTVLFFLAPPIQEADFKIKDGLYLVRGDEDLSESDIVIVELSQRAEIEIPYTFPWPNYVYAKLIENLNRAGAKVIVMDLLFDQDDVYDAENDRLLANAVREAGNVIFMAELNEQADRHIAGITIEQMHPVFPKSQFLNSTPHPPAFSEFTPDSDGFVRRYPLQRTYRNVTYNSLALQVLSFLYPDSSFSGSEKGKYLGFGEYSIPFSGQNNMLINYYGPRESFEYVSLERVVDDQDFQTTSEIIAFEVNEFDNPEYGLLYEDLLREKIVFVGKTNPVFQANKRVPIPHNGENYTMPGVEIHAHALQSILDKKILRDFSGAANFTIVVLILILVFFTTYRFDGKAGILITISSVLLWTLAVLGAFMIFNTLLPVLTVFLAILFGYTGSTLKKVVDEAGEKNKIKGMFSSYVSPGLVNKLIRNDVSFKLGGSKENLTVLFTDIENFTSLSEKAEPENMVALMNRYLKNITEQINRQNGTLDKYIGDAVMSIYGAPLPSDNHAADACRTVLETGCDWTDTDGTVLKTRFGINTGWMIVGNIGSETRFNYTVLGDQVNVAKRCEAACKLFGVYMIVTDTTRKEANMDGEFLFRQLGLVKVRGRIGRVRLYQLVAYAAEADEFVTEMIELFEEGLRFFYKREFENAKKIFQMTLEMEEVQFGSGKSHNPSKLYIGLCEKYTSAPPAESWKGVVEE